MDNWTFLTNHGHVFLCIAADPGIRLLDVATKVGITERSAQRIVADLIDEGYLKHTRVGRRNHYQIRPDLPLRHPLEKKNAVGTLLELLDRGPAQAVSRKQGQLTRQEIVSPHSQQKTGGPRDLKGSKG